MIRHLAIIWFSGVLTLAAAETPDLLRFVNGDQLHGTFQGFKDGPQAVWLRDDVKSPVDFKTSRLRHIVLRGGRPAKTLESLSHVALVNGDRVPGTIVGMDAGWVTVDTSYAGVLRIPRDKVAMLAPSPLGGRLRYHGPFVADEWKMAHAGFPDGFPAESPAAAAKPAKGKADDDQPGRWQFVGSAWYWAAAKQYGTALLRENVMPDRAILKFDIAWKSRLSLAVAFHADLAKAKLADRQDEDRPIGRGFGFVPGDSTILPLLFGNSYVLQLFSTHLRLYRTTVNERGEPSIQSMTINGNGARLGDSGHATVEIRSNRLSGDITLFINDEFVCQWNGAGTGAQDDDVPAPKGSGFGFVVQSEDALMKVSDVLVAEWNGMPDSARSLQVDDQDIVLLANGTDRFSGKLVSLDDGTIHFSTKYGNFKFRLDDVAEVRFARNGLARESEVPADNLVIRLSPFGQISGRPLSGTASSLRVLNPVFGEISFNLESAVMLDFQPAGNFIDDWDVEF